MQNSKNLTKELLKLNITHIYCSPFLRVLQTINDFSLCKSLLVNIEYALYEYLGPDYLTENICSVRNIPWFLSRCNNSYNSVYPIEKLKLNENLEDVKIRVNKFLQYLQNSAHSNDDVILIVSHMTTLEIFSDLLFCQKISLGMGQLYLNEVYV